MPEINLRNSFQGNVILDFDGTLVDSFDVALDVAQTLLGRQFDEHEVGELRGLPLQDIFAKLQISKVHALRIVPQARHMIAEQMPNIQFFPGIADQVRILHAEGHRLFVATSNDEAAVRSLLARNGILDAFDDIQGGISLFGKARKISKLLKTHQLDINRSLYVGDEHRDIEAAHKVGIRCIAVAWGYSTPSALHDFQPDALVERPQDLVATADKLLAV